MSDYCPKCHSAKIEIRSRLYAMATRYMPEEYEQRAECHECGWSGDVTDLLQHKDLPSRIMLCEACGIYGVHHATNNGWMCWCGNERDE